MVVKLKQSHIYESMAFKLFSSTFKNIKMICTKFRKEKKKKENHPQFYHSDKTAKILMKKVKDWG